MKEIEAFLTTEIDVRAVMDGWTQSLGYDPVLRVGVIFVGFISIYATIIYLQNRSMYVAQRKNPEYFELLNRYNAKEIQIKDSNEGRQLLVLTDSEKILVQCHYKNKRKTKYELTEINREALV